MKIVQRTELIETMCTGRRVLHLGCSDYPYTQQSIDGGSNLHLKLAKLASDLWGVDGDASGLDVLRDHGCSQLAVADLEHLDEAPLSGVFDVIVAGEIIEHLNNPGAFLTTVKRWMAPETVLVITTVNAYCAMRFLYYGLRGQKGTAEPVHPDHVAYYSYSTLKLLIERHAMAIDSFAFYDIGKEHRPFNRWYLNLTNDVAVRIAPQWSDGLFVTCRLV